MHNIVTLPYLGTCFHTITSTTGQKTSSAALQLLGNAMSYRSCCFVFQFAVLIIFQIRVWGWVLVWGWGWGWVWMRHMWLPPNCCIMPFSLCLTHGCLSNPFYTQSHTSTMAVVLRLKDIYCFNEAHPKAKETYDVQKTPEEHFNIVFRPLFALACLPKGKNPHNIVTMIRCAAAVRPWLGRWSLC